MTARTFGKAWIADGRWLIEAEPHVTIRLKRVFPRAVQDHARLALRATDEVTRELEWFCERFALEFNAADAREMEQRARRFDALTERLREILSGEYVPGAPGKLSMLLPARDYQEQAAALAAAGRQLLLADTLGLGKTISALATLAQTGALPALVVCPPHLLSQWQAQAWRFLRLLGHIGPTTQPKWPRGRVPDLLILTYSRLVGWRNAVAGVYKTVIFDEAHELRRYDERDPTEKYMAAEHVSSQAEYRLGLTATPIFNYGEEFWSVLNVLAPGVLGSRHEFLREWCGGGGKIANPQAFGSYLRETGLMLRRTKKDVGRELPAHTRVVHEVPCDLDALAEIKGSATELAQIILKQGGAPLDKMRAAGEFDAKMRQATGIAKAPYVAAFVRMLLESEDGPILLFGWHRAVYEVWLQELAEFRPVMFTGSETPVQKVRNLQSFLRKESRVLIMSLRSGSGTDGIQNVCDRYVIGELDWSPGALDQCGGRVYRDGQPNPVMGYYVVTNDGCDPIMQDVIGVKSGQIEGVCDPDAELSELREIDPDHIRKLAESYMRKQKR